MMRRIHGETGQPITFTFSENRGLGVQEYFMPVSSRAFDRLDPAIRDCFDAPDRCKAVIFPLASPLGSGGFMSANAAPRGPGHFVFLLKKGRVAYQAITES